MSDSKSPEGELEEVARLRLKQLLQELEAKGVKQQEVAERVGMSPTFLADLKRGHRQLSELSARRIGEVFSVDYRWLLGQVGTMQTPTVTAEATSRPADGVWLPVFSRPVRGTPERLPVWDGSSVQVVGAAAVRVRLAENPYVLRFAKKDHAGRLRPNDLLLISQRPNEQAEIHVVRIAAKLLLARRGPAGRWEQVVDQEVLDHVDETVGHAMGIVWGPLDL